MLMAKGVHRVDQHRSALRGVEAVSLLTDRCYPRHAHDHLGIGLMCRGAHRSWSGIGHVEAEAGDMITVNPGEMHDGSPIDGKARAWRMLYFDPGLVARVIEAEGVGSGELVRPSLRDIPLAGCFSALFAALTDPLPDVMAVEQRLLHCLVYAVQWHGARPAPLANAKPTVAKARRRIDEAPQQAWTLADLAAVESISRFQLLRAFVRDVGATPHAYLVQRRVGLARRHIAGGLSIAEAALVAGFADQSHLTRSFVKQFGVTPARYRAALA